MGLSDWVGFSLIPSFQDRNSSKESGSRVGKGILRSLLLFGFHLKMTGSASFRNDATSSLTSMCGLSYLDLRMMNFGQLEISSLSMNKSIRFLVVPWLVFLSGVATAGRSKKDVKVEPLTRNYQNSRYKSYEHFLNEVPSVNSLKRESAPLARRTEVREKFSRIRPTQSEYGLTLIDANVERQSRKAKGRRLSKLELVKERAKAYAVPAVLDHIGRVYVLDSHHGLWTNLRLLEESKGDPFILLKILKDFRGKTKDDFVHGVFGPASKGGLAKGQYLRELKDATLMEKFNSLPPTFKEMKDNPHRSLVGAALSNYSVQADNLKDYVEFMIIDKMLDLGLVPSTNLRFNKFNIFNYANVIYREPMFQFMKTTLRKEEKRSEFEEQLLKATVLIDR